MFRKHLISIPIILVVMSFLVAACQPTEVVVTEIVEKEVVVTQEVEKEVIVTQEVITTVEVEVEAPKGPEGPCE